MGLREHAVSRSGLEVEEWGCHEHVVRLFSRRVGGQSSSALGRKGAGIWGLAGLGFKLYRSNGRV